MKALVAAALLSLGGCYGGPYEQALLSPGYPIQPPPNSNGTLDRQASLPYDQSPWFTGERLQLPGQSPVRAR